MANVTVTATTPLISVDSTNLAVAVSTTTSNIVISQTSAISNVDVRSALSAVDAGGDGSFAYNSTTGVFTYTGPNQAEANARIAAAPTQVRAHLSANSGVDYDSSTGVITANTTPVSYTHLTLPTKRIV